MKAYVDVLPTGLSRGIHRVAAALRAYSGPDIQIVSNPEEADLQVAHVVGFDATKTVKAPAYAVVQYCGGDGVRRDGPAAWAPIWKGAVVVWSYYDLRDALPEGTGCYLAPLGVDRPFTEPFAEQERKLVLTSGYVHGPGAEAIEEVAWAAIRSGLIPVHIGPFPVGMTRVPPGWRTVHDISDIELAALYRQARWVSGLRHVEGFELPALEGIMCGARPVVFDRADMRRWYDGHAAFVSEREGGPLEDDLAGIFCTPTNSVTEAERLAIRNQFNWEPIVKGFWGAIAQNLNSKGSVRRRR